MQDDNLTPAPIDWSDPQAVLAWGEAAIHEKRAIKMRRTPRTLEIHLADGLNTRMRFVWHTPVFARRSSTWWTA